MNDSYVEIDVNRIKTNVRNIITKYNDYKYYIGVIKGNAYGHGFGIVKEIVKSGINYLAVSTLKEAVEVRKLVKTPILLLQPISIKDLAIAEENNITITISSYRFYQELIKQNIKIKVHLKLDTGMNRLGINNKAQVEEIYNNLIDNKDIKLEGIYTHLSTIGIIDKKWDEEINNFFKLTNTIDLSKVSIVHIYSSNSLVIHPKLGFCNGVRLGILMYGIGPRPINYSGIKGYLRKIKNEHLRKKYKLSPILNDYDVGVEPGFKLCSRVVEIKDVDKNEYIGYGLKYKTKRKCKVAIVPIGYADGLTLQNSGRCVLINDKPYKIVGSVNMKMLTVLVDNKVDINDEVVVIGDNNIRSICNYTNVTPHNLLTTVPSSVERFYK